MSELFLSDTPSQQAINQLLALLVTLALACFGGLVTGNDGVLSHPTQTSVFICFATYSGLLMHSVGKLTSLSEEDMFNDNTNIDAMADKCEVILL